jgi:hypothetical protein
VNKTSKKLAGRGRKKDAHFVNNLIVGAGPSSSSRPVVELVEEDHVEERVDASAKR